MLEALVTKMTSDAMVRLIRDAEKRDAGDIEVPGLTCGRGIKLN